MQYAAFSNLSTWIIWYEACSVLFMCTMQYEASNVLSACAMLCAASRVLSACTMRTKHVVFFQFVQCNKERPLLFLNVYNGMCSIQ